MENWYDMAPPGVGVAPWKGMPRTRIQVVELQRRCSTIVSRRTRSTPLGRVPLDTQTPHDLEQARVIGQPELLRRLGHVPFVALQRLNHDLPLRFLFLLLKGARF